MIELSQETEALAQRVAAAQRLSVDDAIRLALTPKQRKPRDRSPEAIAARYAALERFAAEIRAMPILDPRSVEEIVDDIKAL